MTDEPEFHFRTVTPEEYRMMEAYETIAATFEAAKTTIREAISEAYQEEGVTPKSEAPTEPEFSYRVVKPTPAGLRMMSAFEIIAYVGRGQGREGGIDLQSALEALEEGYHEGVEERQGVPPPDPKGYFIDK